MNFLFPGKRIILLRTSRIILGHVMSFYLRVRCATESNNQMVYYVDILVLDNNLMVSNIPHIDVNPDWVSKLMIIIKRYNIPLGSLFQMNDFSLVDVLNLQNQQNLGFYAFEKIYDTSDVQGWVVMWINKNK